MPSHSLRRRSRGQSLAEFAIAFPVLFLIVGGIIQFGMIFWGVNTLNQIVRDAGRYAVTEPDCSKPPTPNSSVADVTQKVRDIAASSSLAATLGTITVTMPTADTTDSCPPTSNAKHVWISIAVEAQVPVFFPWIPGNGHISSAAQFRMEPVATP